jgi:hypothetical protein
MSGALHLITIIDHGTLSRYRDGETFLMVLVAQMRIQRLTAMDDHQMQTNNEMNRAAPIVVCGISSMLFHWGDSRELIDAFYFHYLRQLSPEDTRHVLIIRALFTVICPRNNFRIYFMLMVTDSHQTFGYMTYDMKSLQKEWPADDQRELRLCQKRQDGPSF